ncbi:MAG: restriction endonuclease subunit S [Truepera sp.]|nr:restriction endonuclease subunit S [Truepera sp.]
MNDLVKISDVFDVSYGSNLELVNLKQCESTGKHAIPFVSRDGKNNGVSAYVERVPDTEPNPAHTLSVALGGSSVLSTFYQPLPYYSGFHVFVLVPKRKLSVIEMLFHARCISANQYKYSYGRQANRTLREILIPSKIPPWLEVELQSFYKKDSKSLSNKALIDQDISLETQNWESFELTRLFNIKGSKTTPLLKLEGIGVGQYPFVTTRATNNGVRGFYDHYTECGNVIAVDSAVLGYCTYQSNPFSASDHVEKLIPAFKMSKYVALFLTTILNMEQYRFNYGLKCSQGRLKELTIKLPSKDGCPDFEFMEKYIKSLPYSVNL